MQGTKYLKLIARQWQDHHPSLYAHYLKAGTLDRELAAKAQEIAAQVQALVEGGMAPAQAEEVVLKEEVYGPPESAQA